MSGTYYKELIVWQKSLLLVKHIYLVTQKFPPHELYGLVNQMRRAAVSIPSNIAEGQMRNSPAEFARFLAIASGSLAELETQMIIAQEIGYMTQQQGAEFFSLHSEVSRMLTALKNKIIQLKTNDGQLTTKNLPHQ
jgi:S23 ribosomal protein.